uniref:Sulfotransferase family protein n=1 Tax=Candidatus Kentrum sp. FM TaxID=2126340 RepID=A0A450T9F6_9GAMM|nr:MAG: Sulfotransferase family protein [Candidatus Kentron sp. FM]VFJ67741.1 MAG: Sulfotransferase family protein [Candidatus Kentron sp. FM]VFK17111.1 MAG: Sulfotransferase family protein [Candidatus Kentron sp. FM]
MNREKGTGKDDREFLIFDDRGAAYLVVSKVACTSIKHAIAGSYGISSETVMDIHDERLWHRELGASRGIPKNYFRFAFVRDPFDRLVSCYRDKIIFVGDGNDNTEVPYFENFSVNRIEAGIGFGEFVEIVAKIDDAHADRHFKSQYAVLYEKGNPLVDFIGKFETLAEDWDYIARRLDFNPILASLNDSKGKKGQNIKRDYREYYTPEIADMVYARYQNDVHAFGYEKEYRVLCAKR